LSKIGLRAGWCSPPGALLLDIQEPAPPFGRFSSMLGSCPTASAPVHVYALYNLKVMTLFRQSPLTLPGGYDTLAHKRILSCAGRKRAPAVGAERIQEIVP
jgi:hypothetical protein